MTAEQDVRLGARAGLARLAGPSSALLPLRLVAAWMFLSAFHRRALLDGAKLVAGSPGYVGEKFNVFMPGSILGVGDLIGALLDHPSALHVFLWSFTVIEGLVGLALLLGLATRLAALGALLLSAGILFGSGWLGPTCLDEWQIGALGIAAGATLLLGGAGPLSLDAVLSRAFPRLYAHRAVRLAADPAPAAPPALVLGLALVAFGVTLGTNQVFHGGLWGPLHNDSVRPRVDVLDLRADNDAGQDGGRLRLSLERPVGPETYGAFVIDLHVRDAHGATLVHYDAAALAALPAHQIENRWLVRVRPGPHGLVVPLGARATLTLPVDPALGHALADGDYRVDLEDVSGARWTRTLALHRD